MLVNANISLNKLNNLHFRGFLERHTNHNIPDESTLRKNYLPQSYEQTVVKIRERVSGNKLWVSIDETTDASGRYVANVIIGILSPTHAGQKFLLTTEILPKVNNSTITSLFETSMSLVWPLGIHYDDVMLFVTDAAPYMVKAAKEIQIRYTKMVHVTCLAHGLHRVADTIRGSYTEVDRFIANMKKVFRKAPSIIMTFREMAANIPMPPSPVLTRWC